MNIELPAKQVVEHAIFLAYETDEVEEEIDSNLSDEMDDVSVSDMVRGLDRAEWEGDSAWFEGTFTVQEVVGRLPASGGSRFEPPTNPPEVITEDRKLGYTVRWWPEDLGRAEMFVYHY